MVAGPKVLVAFPETAADDQASAFFHMAGEQCRLFGTQADQVGSYQDIVGLQPLFRKKRSEEHVEEHTALAEFLAGRHLAIIVIGEQGDARERPRVYIFGLMPPKKFIVGTGGFKIGQRGRLSEEEVALEPA